MKRTRENGLDGSGFQPNLLNPGFKREMDTKRRRVGPLQQQNLDSLTTDILVYEISKYLTTEDINNLMLVNKTLNRVYTSEKFWQFYTNLTFCKKDFSARSYYKMVWDLFKTKNTEKKIDWVLDNNYDSIPPAIIKRIGPISSWIQKNYFNKNIMNNDLNSVKKLVKLGFDVNPDRSEPPLYLASQEGHLDICKYLVENGANIKQTFMDGKTILYIAVKKNHFPVVKYLVEMGAKVDVFTRFFIPLWFASENNNYDICKYLLDHGANIEQKANDGSTPLLVASEKGNLKIVKLLIEYGANILAECSKGLNSICYASQPGHYNIVKKICSCFRQMDDGKNKLKNLINKKTDQYETSLFIASQNGHAQIVGYLIKHGAEVNTGCFAKNYTPLYIACKKNRPEIIKILCDHGADITKVNSDGESALDIITSENYAACKAILKLFL